ncbi:MULTISPECIES: ABC transporter substrate-binding protein [unclassified Bosea (in: a-proteobacteria)]|uniref:ABC transporter substrate-binding protein n=1 Tax=unclassified Bosea (in: a-proteobacteria) TaxID=2653178 RepID=UPI000F7EDFCF|nr:MULTISPECIES: ABC transporter substrate-binding protein [unclassified Bosea (in: a-proteobacteria)]RXT22326.1 ABC transporter substrate-binding protein [Bosea sp. Tri-39]RXT33157.1 ABC transporter substrate-binding protein [Bosea sp. Tri-54]
MSKIKISRRGLLGAAGAASAVSLFAGPWQHNRVWAQGAAKPLRIGITADASGMYANSGASDKRGMAMAIAEANERGGVLGRKVEFVHIDTETTAATGSRVAERMISREQCGFLVGAVHSGVANAISQVAQKYGVVYINTNSSSPTEAGQNCHRVKFVFDGNGTNFAKAAVKSAIERFGPDWMLLTNDYVWGHDTAAATKTLLKEYGGKVMEEVLIPQGTRDFTSALLKVQQRKPGVISAAIGGDDQKAMRQQVVQLKMGDKPAWINSQQDWDDVYGLPIETLFGVFGTTWYYRLDLPGVADFVKRYQAMYPETAMRSPGNVFYNGYMAIRELLGAVERAGTTNNIAVIKALEGHRISARDRMQHFDASIDAQTHQVQQTIYLATANKAPKEKDDIFEVLSQAKAEDVRDTDSAKLCKLEPYEQTPTFDA